MIMLHCALLVSVYVCVCVHTCHSVCVIDSVGCVCTRVFRGAKRVCVRTGVFVCAGRKNNTTVVIYISERNLCTAWSLVISLSEDANSLRPSSGLSAVSRAWRAE